MMNDPTLMALLAQTSLYSGMPEDVQYQSGSQLPYAYQVSANGPDYDVLSALKQRALSTGQSPWATAALKKQAGEEQTARDNIVAQGNAGAQAMRDNIAMTHGLSSGAAERANMFAMNQTQNSLQKNANQGMMARADIDMNDDKSRTALLENLPSIQNTAYAPQNQAQEFNARMAFTNDAARNAFNLGQYDSKMKAWGANKQAEATENSGKK